MIFDWVLDMVYGLLSPLIGLLPDAGDLGVSSGFDGWLASLDQVVAVQGPFAFIAVLLLAVPLFIGLRIVVWLYRLIPGKLT